MPYHANNIILFTNQLMTLVIKKIVLLFFLIILQSISLGAWALKPYSTDELDELENEFVQQINLSPQIIRTPLANQYINQLGKGLARFAHIPKPYFFLVRSGDINAFAGPGGYIGINSQLILVSDNESELAAVMAHELAHVRLHHLYSMIEHQKQMRIPMLASLLASAALGVVNPTLASGAMMASLTGFAQDNINFTRAREKEADRIGIDMLIRSGLNPLAMANFFKKMQQHTRYYYTANLPAILRTHPMDDDRIAEADNRSLHLANKHYPDNPEYYLFKELIRTSSVSNSKTLLDYYQHKCQRNQPIACQYGYVMTLIDLNQFKQAETHLAPLLNNDPTNLFFQLAMADIETGSKQFASALTRLQALQTSHPNNYAVLMAYAQGLLAAGHGEQAVSVLLKGTRQFKKNLTLCETLAQAQSAIHQKAYAYFTEAQCQLLQGRSRDALRKLHIVSHLAKHNHYLLARAQAMIEDIKYRMEK